MQKEERGEQTFTKNAMSLYQYQSEIKSFFPRIHHQVSGILLVGFFKQLGR